MLVARAPRVFTFRVPTRPVGSCKSTPTSRTTLLPFNHQRLVSRQQIKHASAVGLVGVVSGDLKHKWSVKQDKKRKDGILHPAPKQLPGDSGKLASIMYSVLVDKYGDEPKNLIPPLDRLDKDMQKIILATKAYPEYLAMFNMQSKNLPPKVAAGINELLKGINAGEETKKFVDLLIDLGTLKLFLPTARDFNVLAKVVRGEIEFTLTTAQPLTDAQLKEWQSKLSLALRKGETLILHTKVDPSILSGYVLDSSLLRTRNTGLDEYIQYKESFKRAWEAYEVAFKARLDPKFNWSVLAATQKTLAAMLDKPNIELQNVVAPYTPPKTEKQLKEDLRKNGLTVSNLTLLGVNLV